MWILVSIVAFIITVNIILTYIYKYVTIIDCCKYRVLTVSMHFFRRRNLEVSETKMSLVEYNLLYR